MKDHKIRLVATVLISIQIREAALLTSEQAVCELMLHVSVCLYLIIPQTDPMCWLLTRKALSFLLEINRGTVPSGHQVTDDFWTRMLLLAIPLLYT